MFDFSGLLLIAFILLASNLWKKGRMGEKFAQMAQENKAPGNQKTPQSVRDVQVKPVPAQSSFVSSHQPLPDKDSYQSMDFKSSEYQPGQTIDFSRTNFDWVERSFSDDDSIRKFGEDNKGVPVSASPALRQVFSRNIVPRLRGEDLVRAAVMHEVLSRPRSARYKSRRQA